MRSAIADAVLLRCGTRHGCHSRHEPAHGGGGSVAKRAWV